MNFKQWLRIIIFVLLSALIFTAVISFISVLDARDKTGMHGFYLEEENTIDVALIGASSVYVSFYSPYAWELEGFTSYSVATGGLTGKMYPYVLHEVKRVQNADLILIDISGYTFIDQNDHLALRRYLDSIPDCEVKTAMINDIAPYYDKRSYMLPFLQYHSNWQHPKGALKAWRDIYDMDRYGYSITKNFCVYTGIYSENRTIEDFIFPAEGVAALDNTINNLKALDVKQALFIRFPYYDELRDDSSVTEAIKYIKESGYDYLDLTESSDSIGIDFSNDFYDKEHVNIFGCWKITEFLSKYISDNYDLRRNYSDNTINEWNDCAKRNQTVFDVAKNMTLSKEDNGLYTQRDFFGRLEK